MTALSKITQALRIRKSAKLLAALMITRAVSHSLFLLSHLSPRRQNLWVFGSWRGTRFADNARYLFLYCSSANLANVECVWISSSHAIVQQLRQNGLVAQHKWSLAGIRAALRAGVYVFDFRSSDIAYELSGGALRINLWHGVPLKRIERDIEDPNHPVSMAQRGPLHSRLFWRFLVPQNYETCDYIVAPGRGSAKTLGSAFRLGPDRVLLTGYPRNDAMFGADWTRRAASRTDRSIAEALEQDQRQGLRLICYLPTWQDKARFLRIPRQLPLPVPELEAVLAANHAKLYCKFHHVDHVDHEELERVRSSSRMTLLPADVDIYQHLGRFDALITDYSSIYFDYLLLDRPLIFYAHDLEEYQELRTFYYDYESVTPGPKVYTPGDLVASLERLLVDYEGAIEEWRDARMRVRSAMHCYVDGESSRRCLEQIQALLTSAAARP